ncbi:hypothetical protein LPUS_08284 [Lasallia pustulata]|uniref:Uncharacterized protein n=1 Tax=Lasallia pustulata TaxID=136370 RepID=A0A1W5D5A8_9LECA|nr:hypothetical protein LPUS_08284 [Lasallia pustulata]
MPPRTPSLLLLLTTLSILLALASAATPTSFCKCTCFTNSTIIALDARPNNSPPSSRAFLARANGGGEKEDERKEYRARNCNDCNRQFCLGYSLPICKGADVGDVFTMCFQRDSRKDEAVVIFFIFATAGLLGWAAVKPWVDKCVQVSLRSPLL